MHARHTIRVHTVSYNQFYQKADPFLKKLMNTHLLFWNLPFILAKKDEFKFACPTYNLDSDKLKKLVFGTVLCCAAL